MRVLGLLLGPVNGEGISGGDRHALEVWQSWATEPGNHVSVLSCFWGPRIAAKFGYDKVSMVSVERNANVVGPARLQYVKRAANALLFPAEPRDFDVIHASSSYFYDLLPAIALKRNNRGSILVASLFHLIPPPWQRTGNFVGNSLAWLEQRLMLLLVRTFADFVIVDNAELVEDLVRLGVRKSRVILSPMGVGARPPARPLDGSTSFDAAYVGRLSLRKNVDDLLRVWRSVCDKLPGSRLALIGNEDGTFSVEKQIRELHLGGNVEVYTQLSDEDVFRKLMQSRTFITASREEGYGLSVLEALSVGLPCATFEIPAFTMAFPRGRHRARDLSNDALAAAAVELLSQPELYERLRAEAAATRVMSWADVAGAIERALVRPRPEQEPRNP